MRRDEPSRHGRAADALIASYLRELVAEDPSRVPPTAEPLPRELSAPALASSADAAGSQLEATV